MHIKSKRKDILGETNKKQLCNLQIRHTQMRIISTEKMRGKFLSFLCHIALENMFKRQIIMGKINVKRSRGRRRT